MMFSTCTHDDSLVPGTNPDLKSGNLILSDFQKYLKADMDYNKITAIFGVPSKDIGSGIHIYVYKLADSTEIWIGYANKIIYARHLDAKGSVLNIII
jgi:hypothetical protein